MSAPASRFSRQYNVRVTETDILLIKQAHAGVGPNVSENAVVRAALRIGLRKLCEKPHQFLAHIAQTDEGEPPCQK